MRITEEAFKLCFLDETEEAKVRQARLGEPGQVGCKKKKQFSCAKIRAKTEWTNDVVIRET